MKSTIEQEKIISEAQDYIKRLNFKLTIAQLRLVREDRA